MEELIEKILSTFDCELFGNSIRDYTESFVAILIGILIVKIFQRFVIRRVHFWAKKTSNTWDDLLLTTLEHNAVPALMVFIFYLGLRDLEMRHSLRIAVQALSTIAITVFSIRVALAILTHALKLRWLKHGTDVKIAEKNLNGILTLIQIVVWILGSVILLDNLGVKVSAFVAGLGITGIAVALAAQTILGDLFGYFVIFFDQPFEVGHVIKVDSFTGEVEHIGLKTTRLRSMDGEQIVISNKFLTDSRVQNFRRMHRRRAQFQFEVSYTTPTELLKAIPERIKTLLENFSEVTFDRSHFKDFTTSGLRFETNYFIETPNYGRYMDIQQSVNLALHQDFTEKGIEFSVPGRIPPLSQS